MLTPITPEEMGFININTEHYIKYWKKFGAVSSLIVELAGAEAFLRLIEDDLEWRLPGSQAIPILTREQRIQSIRSGSIRMSLGGHGLKIEQIEMLVGEPEKSFVPALHGLLREKGYHFR